MFLKTDTYALGSNTIHKLTLQSNSRHYSYSMCAFDVELLSQKVDVEDEIIPKVVVCSVLTNASKYGEWFAIFSKEYPNEFMCRNCNGCGKEGTCKHLYDEYIHLARLGNEDICINIFNCRMKHFLEM